MFNQLSYNIHDKPAKEAVSGWLTQRANIVIESGRYDRDLSVSNPAGQHLAFECERRTIPHWCNGNPFPYPTITIPTRKQKFADESTYFATVNLSLTAMVVLSSAAVTGSPIISRYASGRGQECFYDVPIASGWQFSLPSPQPVHPI